MGSQFRGAASLTLGLLLSLLFWAPAYAHAAYESSDPADGATVSNPPSRVTAEFTEPVVDDSTLEVYDPCGTRVDNGDSLVAADRITVSMSADKQGTYRVHFSVVSSVDGHPTSGDFGFTSSGGSPCPGEESAEEEPSEGSGGAEGNGQSDDGSAGNTGSDQPGGSSSRSGAGSQADTGSREMNERAGEDRARGNNSETTRMDSARVKTSRAERAAQDVASAPTALSVSDIASIWHGIPLQDFLIALMVAAVIGGAGGFVYAGIMGPRP
jgi:methionine-rich copper-binding protein CopC